MQEVWSDLPDNDNYNDHQNHQATNDRDKVEHFSLECRHAFLWFIGELGNSAKDGIIPRGNHNSCTSARDTMSSL